MPATILTNDATATLAASMAAGDVTLTVVSGSQFPITGKFHIRIDDEIMWVTAVSGSTWTVTRAAESCAGAQVAAVHSAGVTIYGVFTVDALTPAAAPGSYTNPVVTLDSYGRLQSIANGQNHFFSDTGVPNDAVGLTGDYYLDLITSLLYRKS